MRALCALVSVFLGLSLATPTGLVLCLGADGHLAIEASSGDEGCQGCDDGAPTASAMVDRPSMQRVASCTCVDVRIGVATQRVCSPARTAVPSQTPRDVVWTPSTDAVALLPSLVAAECARGDVALRPPPDLRRAVTTVLLV